MLATTFREIFLPWTETLHTYPASRITSPTFKLTRYHSPLALGRLMPSSRPMCTHIGSSITAQTGVSQPTNYPSPEASHRASKMDKWAHSAPSFQVQAHRESRTIR